MITLSNGKVVLETQEGKIEFAPDKSLQTIHVHAEVDTTTGKIVSYSLSPGSQKEIIEEVTKESTKSKDTGAKKVSEETVRENDSPTTSS